jgi:hypothetical protein
MGKPLKITIIGLPLFGERLAKALQSFDQENNYSFLNTYYNKWDKLKAYFRIPKSDVVFSINGSILTSGVFDRTLKSKVPLVMNWVGTDVMLAAEAMANGSYRKDYIDKAHHFCEVNWIREELDVIGIHAEIMNFASFEKDFELLMPVSKKLTVLTYIPAVRSDFYGIQEFLDVAKDLTEIDFLIVGTEAKEYMPLPKNVKALGWVKDMDEIYAQAHIAVRIPQHDGLSTFILESLARGKQVIYKYALDQCHLAKTKDELVFKLKELNDVFKFGHWKLNSEGANFVRDEFNRETIMKNLTSKLRKIAKQKK